MSAIRSLASKWVMPLLGVWFLLTGIIVLFGLSVPAVVMGILAIIVGIFALIAS